MKNYLLAFMLMAGATSALADNYDYQIVVV